uniref:ATP synthase F0 subunit 6 n=1 Tax=Apphia nigricauda TaxID=3062133 RepID=UPI00286C8B66|nr:ATP synthase F0 subunit 6 [Apphia nigricauda]WKK49899.1 ATP synthase F0 subunit 6 [Apphia nigricauda]
MMTNLFSVFDPCTGMLSLNWLSTMIFMILIPYNFWLIPNKISLIFNKVLINLSSEMSMLMPYNGMSLIMLGIFVFILVNNSMGLIPYVFTSSSHLVFSLSLALPMWLSFMIYGWINNTNMMFIHLVPIGTPSVLMPFMVLIETISNLIRPGSLAVRLTANMIAGHLLMSLLGGSGLGIMIILMMIFMLLMSFEIAVSIIQAYVFMTLATLYSSEV